MVNLFMFMILCFELVLTLALKGLQAVYIANLFYLCMEGINLYSTVKLQTKWLIV
jgi:hypothetical protein